MRSFLRFSTVLALLASTSGLAPPAQAQEPCALDPGPAATLFLPYFEVDLSKPNGQTTLFSVVNTAAVSVLARVTLWTDLGYPTLPFTIYLTGYDVETVNLRDVLDGRMPQTASAAQDPVDRISPQGPLSQDSPFLNCGAFLPPPNLPSGHVASMQAEHRGLPSARLSGQCVGANHGDGFARGYVTIDTVNGCSLKTPADAGYFGPGGEATNQNILWGDYFYVDPTGNAAQGEALVRVQAFPQRFLVGQKTFYGSLQAGSVANAREPLAFSWLSRFLNGGAFDGGTDLIVWQDPEGPRAPFICGTGTPAAIRTHSLVMFDEEENAEIDDGSCDICSPPGPGYITPFPWVSNRVSVGGPHLSVPFAFGYLVTGTGEASPRQSWVGTVMSAEGRFGVGFASNALDSACGSPACPSGVCVP